VVQHRQVQHHHGLVADRRRRRGQHRDLLGVGDSGSVRTGTWKSTATSSSYLGGKAVYSSAKGASAGYTFTGQDLDPGPRRTREALPA
jgi:hypothetical protein